MIYKDKFYRISGFLIGKDSREQYIDKRLYNTKELIAFLKSNNFDRYELSYIDCMERFKFVGFKLVDKTFKNIFFQNIEMFPKDLKKFYRIGDDKNAEKE